jgi:PAS domain S-box-containing protein
VAGRSWRVICTPVAGSALVTARGYPWAILAGALLVTLLVAGYLLVLAASEARTRAVIESASDGIVLVGPDGRVERLNAAAERLFGWTGAEAAGHAFLEALVAPASRAEARALLQALETADGARADRELRGQRRDGSEFPMSCSAGAAHAAGATLTALFVRDLTEAQQRELELRQAQKLEAVGRLAAGIAHEINTPIQFIGDNTRFLEEAFQGYDRVLEAQRGLLPAAAAEPVARLAAEVDLDELRAEVPRTLERTIQGVRRVATIVRAMKEFAHPDQKQMVATDLNRGIQATVEVARNEYKYVATLVTDLGPLPPVVCHAGDLNQVVLNLVVNASHAVAEVHDRTGARGTIRVSTAREGDCAVIRVADSGPGIPAAIRDRIFDPFFTTKEVGRGSGQGLAIARTIVAAHRGTIGFETAEGAGTTFTVRIPLDGGASAGDPRGATGGA